MTDSTPPARVMVVDDDDAVRKSLARYLKATGFETEAAEDGQRALELLEGQRFDAMVSDIKMPGMSGIELLSEALSRDPDLAVIMLTGVGQPDSAIQCLKNGAMDYLIKPVEMEELGISLQFALRKRQWEIDRRDLQQWLAREVEVKTREVEEHAQRLETLAMEVLTSLVDSIEPKGPAGLGHSARVSLLSVRVAPRLGQGPDDVEMIRLAGRLQGIGRVALRDEGLRRASAQPQELVGTMDAADLAARVLAPLKRYRRVAEIVRHRHERWDGRGHPDGLRGEAIPVGSRIVAAAALYDELTEGAENGQALGPADALDNMRAFAGTLLDPGVVEALAEVLLEG